jgi:autotransporter-associated beta strand protein
LCRQAGAIALLLGLFALLAAGPAWAQCVGNVCTVASATDLVNALTTADNNPGNYTINITADITLTSGTTLPAITGTGNGVNINGNNHTLDGGNVQRGFFVYQGVLSINNLTISHTVATGGDGNGNGGGGAGLGSALFVATDGVAFLDNNVSLISNSATGGAGAAGTQATVFGGGGLGGAGGNATGGSGGGGGGAGVDATGGTNANGGAGILIGTPSAGAAGGHQGGANGGGGAGGGNITGVSGASGGVGGGDAALFDAEPAGFGGGGGGSTGTGGTGGFGGGGGGSGQGGFGGGGGGGGTGGGSGTNGFGAGAGGSGTGGPGGGGGGLGAGGAIFVQGGGRLIFDGSLTIDGNAVTAGGGGLGGGGGAGTDGQALGSGLFLQGNGGVTFAPHANETVTISDDIADQTGSGGTGQNAGTYVLVKQGAGTLVLAGTNTYSGGTKVSVGTLSISSDANLGNGGTVALAAGTTLDFTASGTYSHAITVAGDPAFDVGSGLTVTQTGAIADATNLGTTIPGTVEKTGAGTLVLNVANSYSGGTVIAGGTVQLGDDSALGTGGVDMTASGTTLDLVNHSVTIGDLAGVSGSQVILRLGSLTTGGDGASTSFARTFFGSGGLTKEGSGTFTLGGNSTNYIGNITVSGGTLSISSSGNLGIGGTLAL